MTPQEKAQAEADAMVRIRTAGTKEEAIRHALAGGVDPDMAGRSFDYQNSSWDARSNALRQAVDARDLLYGDLRTSLGKLDALKNRINAEKDTEKKAKLQSEYDTLRKRLDTIYEGYLPLEIDPLYDFKKDILDTVFTDNAIRQHAIMKGMIAEEEMMPTQRAMMRAAYAAQTASKIRGSGRGRGGVSTLDADLTAKIKPLLYRQDRAFDMGGALGYYEWVQSARAIQVILCAAGVIDFMMLDPSLEEWEQRRKTRLESMRPLADTGVTLPKGTTETTGEATDRNR